MTASTLDVQPFFVDGEWRYGTGPGFPSINPADGSVAAVVAEAGAADVDEAVRAARRALERASWRDLKPHERARLLSKLADGIDADREALSLAQMEDNGKTIAECRSQAAAAAAAVVRYYAAVCETAEDAITPSRGDFLSFSTHEPVGVIAAITPWNSPLTLEAQKFAPMLAAGNAVILKSSEITPQVSLRYAKLAAQAGFPPGVFNVLTGFGRPLGEALVRHVGVEMITFTGGTATGRAVAQIAAERLVPAMLELGGKSPNIVFEDADLDHAVAGAAYGIFASGGQSCIAGSRIFVHDLVYGRFVARLVERAAALRIGPPTHPATDVAPMASFPHRDQVLRQVEQAKAEGAEVVCGGEPPSDPSLRAGAYVMPTVLDVPDNRLSIAQQEVFGPVASVLRFRDEDDLVERANDTVFGLACGLWTADYKKAFRVARRIKAGTVWINTYRQTSISTPFGGMKASGVGREKGIAGMRAYMAQKSIYLGTNERPLPWP
jgi:acyl-CoA reductase-like NAD-dependent aldehyde dehydrogenase